MDDSSRLITSALDRLIASGIRQRAALAKRLDTAVADVLALHYVIAATATAPGQLARALLVSPSGATSVIDRLGRAGLISRVPGSGTHRVALVATDAGRELQAQALAPLSDAVGRLIEDLPRSDRMLLEAFLARVADLAEREADRLVASAEAHAEARAAAALPPPVLWG